MSAWARHLDDLALGAAATHGHLDDGDVTAALSCLWDLISLPRPEGALPAELAAQADATQRALADLEVRVTATTNRLGRALAQLEAARAGDPAPAAPLFLDQSA